MAGFRGMGTDQIIIATFPALTYNEKKLEVLKTLTCSPILYVTVNKPASVLRKDFQKQGIETRNMLFIDATENASGKSGGPEGGCTRVDSPNDLTELDITISELVKEKKPAIIVFDAVTTLAIYNDEMSVLKFVHGMATKLRDTECKAILACLGDDSTLVKDAAMFADAVVAVM